jgi:metallo-beta-lactamase family protein
VKLQFCGAARTVTGSNYYLDTGKYKIVVDCGAFQGSDSLKKMNYDEFPYEPSEIDFVLVTHGHFDHVGRLPMLVKQGFTGRFICTTATKEIAEIILLDSAHLQKEDHKRWLARAKKSKKYTAKDYHKDNGEMPDAHGNAYETHEPLYNEEDVIKTMQMFETYDYGKSVQLADGLEIRLRNSGHIIGSASIEIWAENAAGQTRKVVFSGDLGQPGARIIKDPDMIREADYVVVESTYGNRLHKSKDETLIEFLAILKEAQQEGGNILIPTFAIERTQKILYELNLFVENKLLKGLEVYLDSPMAIRATEVFKKHPELYDEDARRLLEKGDDPFNFPGFEVSMDVEASKRLINKKNVAIMAGSGMCTGGRIVHHLANNISKKNTHLIFVGYQVQGTLGRKIIEGEPRVRIKGTQYEVHAHVHTLGGFSAHADERDLRYWLRGFGHSPKKIFVTHGEGETAVNFGHNIEQELDIKTEIPKMNEIFELD